MVWHYADVCSLFRSIMSLKRFFIVLYSRSPTIKGSAWNGSLRCLNKSWGFLGCCSLFLVSSWHVFLFFVSGRSSLCEGAGEPKACIPDITNDVVPEDDDSEILSGLTMLHTWFPHWRILFFLRLFVFCFFLYCLLDSLECLPITKRMYAKKTFFLN